MNFLTDHTPLDAAALDLAGVDPASTEPRKQAVRCLECHRTTWNQMGGCDAHWRRPSAIDRTVIDLT
jgi:hypothetical protein